MSNWGNIWQSILIMIIIILFIFSALGTTINVSAKYDRDTFGLYRNYNTDDSREYAVAYDYSDDEVWKAFFIGKYEYEESDMIHLWIYGKAFGEKYEYPNGDPQWYSHAIYIYNSDYPNGTPRIYFHVYYKFSHNNYHWQKFSIPKTYLKKSEWNLIEIRDVDVYVHQEHHGWEINNLRIGVDRTFEVIEDFDQSYWCSGGMGETPTDPTGNHGELMMALELGDTKKKDVSFPPLGYQWDNEWYQGDYEWVYIDDSSDKAKWRTDVSQDQIDKSSYARLFFYGAAWNVQYPQYESTMNILVNGQHVYHFHPMDDFRECRPVGAWSWVEIDVDDLDPGENDFKFYDTSNYQYTNIQIILFTDPYYDDDPGNSKWQYNAGQGTVGNYNYYQDIGELGVYLVLYDNKMKRNDNDPRIYTVEIAEDWPVPTPQVSYRYKNASNPVEGYYGTGYFLHDEEGWDRLELVQNNWTDQEVKQGLYYDETGDTRIGDLSDFLIFSGHGNCNIHLLPEGDNGHVGDTTYDDMCMYTTVGTHGYYEADHYSFSLTPVINRYNDERGQDGYNFNAEWIVFINCKMFGQEDPQNPGEYIYDPDSYVQTMLYHNLHLIMGYFSYFSMGGEEYQFATTLFWRLVDGHIPDAAETIGTAFQRTSETWDEPWAYFGYDDYRTEYIWEQGIAKRDPDYYQYEKFEHRDPDDMFGKYDDDWSGD